MEITNIFINIGISVVSGAAGCRLFVWLGKKWVGNWFEKKSKKYQAELDRTTNELQERLRIEYGSLYQKRVAAIEKIYSKIFILQEHLRLHPTYGYASSSEEESEAYEYLNKLIGILNTLTILINAHLIYFSEEQSQNLLMLDNKIRRYSGIYDGYQRSITEENHLDPMLCPANFISEHKCLLIQDEIEGLLVDVLNQFRVLVGVDNNKK